MKGVSQPFTHFETVTGIGERKEILNQNCTIIVIEMPKEDKDFLILS